jgi:hypothetical protein
MSLTDGITACGAAWNGSSRSTEALMRCFDSPSGQAAPARTAWPARTGPAAGAGG